MNNSKTLSVTKISKTIDIPGFIIDDNILTKVDEIAVQAVSNSDGVENLQLAYWVTSNSEEMSKFDTLDGLLSQVNSELMEIKSISIQYIVPGEAGISIVFNKNGEIELSAYSDAIDFQFNVDRLLREIRRCDQDYNWFTETFFLKHSTHRIILRFIVGLSFSLLFLIGYSFYASNVGVDIDPEIIPKGNEYYNQVENALKSDDVSEKLNILLLAQLKSFKNVQDILARNQRFVTYVVIALIILVIVYLLAKYINGLYPLGFFAFSPQKKILSDINRKREIVWVGVVIGFLVNIVAGVAIGLLN